MDPEKSVIICIPELKEVDMAPLAEFHFHRNTGKSYLGGYLGEEDKRRRWIDDKVKVWVKFIGELAYASGRYPQMSYAELTKSL